VVVTVVVVTVVEVDVEVVGVGEVVAVVDVVGVTVQWLKSMMHVGRQTRNAPPAEPPGHVAPPKSEPSHCSPGSRTPLPHRDGGPVVDVVLVVVVLLVVEVVVGTTQPPDGSQASQQLESVPMQALPPRGGMHDAALDLTRHFLRPLAVTRQHVTVPGRPQVDFAAQRETAERHAGERRPVAMATPATAVAQRT
jgi:hypothetical protein